MNPDFAPIPWGQALLACQSPPVPPIEDCYIDASPISVPEGFPIVTDCDRILFKAGSALASGKHIVFDLDETLLNTDFTAKEHWHPDPLAGMPGALGVESLRYNAMRVDLKRLVCNGRSARRRYRYSPAKYPFLNNPRIRAQWRPGVLALLAGLRAGGATLYLATASAERRWDFLRQRFPLLDDLFPKRRVACGERLFATACELAFGAADQAGDDLEIKHLRERNAFFYLKTPQLLRAAFRAEELDLLVDDSIAAKEAYAFLGCSDRILPVSPIDPHGGAAGKIAEGLDQALAAETGFKAEAFLSVEAWSHTLRHSSFLRFEDPLYWPLVNIPERQGEALKTLNLPQSVLESID